MEAIRQTNSILDLSKMYVNILNNIYITRIRQCVIRGVSELQPDITMSTSLEHQYIIAENRS